MECKHCWRIEADWGELNLKDIDVKYYDLGRIRWRHLGLVCKKCRECLKGNWRYHKKERRR